MIISFLNIWQKGHGKNSGVPIFITIHSDIILQHVNNLLRAQKSKRTEGVLHFVVLKKTSIY